jgi:hypothetical protein
MPPGYVRTANPNDVAHAVLSKSTWSVLALTLHIELFSQAHYHKSIEAENEIDPLFKDIFLFHWREESQHAIVDELELRRIDATLSEAERDAAVVDLIALVGAVDGILQAQANADVDYFLDICGRSLTKVERERLGAETLAAYRWQYIIFGVQEPQFQKVLGDVTSEAQRARIGAALAPLMS